MISGENQYVRNLSIAWPRADAALVMSRRSLIGGAATFGHLGSFSCFGFGFRIANLIIVSAAFQSARMREPLCDSGPDSLIDLCLLVGGLRNAFPQSHINGLFGRLAGCSCWLGSSNQLAGTRTPTLPTKPPTQHIAWCVRFAHPPARDPSEARRRTVDQLGGWLVSGRSPPTAFGFEAAWLAACLKNHASALTPVTCPQPIYQASAASKQASKQARTQAREQGSTAAEGSMEASKATQRAKQAGERGRSPMRLMRR